MKHFCTLFFPIVLCLLLSLSTFGQNRGPFEDFKYDLTNWPISFQRAAKDSLVMFQEQVILHLDKDMVQPKDQLFFRANILTGPKRVLASNSDVLKVELLDASGNLVHNQYHRIDDGTCMGSFSVPNRLKSGEYYFRAYTRWMLNYGPENLTTQKIWIGGPKDFNHTAREGSFKLTIFPEGENLISDLNNRLAVELPRGNVAKLDVVDENDQWITTVNNYGMGVGTFALQPKKGMKYRLKIGDGSFVALPNVQDIGYTMQLSNLFGDKATVRIEASEALREETVYLHGSYRGVDYFKTRVEFNGRSTARVEIKTTELPKGIIELTLKDDFDQIWAKRPLLVDKEELNIAIEKEPSSDENQALSVFVTDTNGTPVQTLLSIAIIEKGFEGYKESNTIGDLTPRNQRFLNDLLVWTKQFSSDYLGKSICEFPTEIKYSFQDGLEFYGQAYDLDDNLLTNTKIQMLISNEDNVLVDEVITNSNGLFSISGLMVEGEVDMIFRTTGDETKNKLVRVIPYDYEVPPLAVGQPNSTLSKKEKTKTKQFVPRRPVAEFNTEESYSRLIALDEVTLVEKKTEKTISPTVYGIEPSRVVYQDIEKPKTIPQLFLSIPGVQVLRIGDIARVTVQLPRAAGVGPILWVLDGLPLVQPTNLGDIMNLVSNIDIERIEILYGPRASIYGTRAAGGAILVYTRSGSNEDYLNRKKGQVPYQGFHESWDFEEYVMEGKSKKQSKELPLTRYWNPNISTDESGKAIIFYRPGKGGKAMEVKIKALKEDGEYGMLNTEIQP